jgi:hypothetical protein
VKKLTLAEAQKQLDDREVWLWRQKHWPKRRWSEQEDDADYELELTGYQAVGAAGDYWDIPNR